MKANLTGEPRIDANERKFFRGKEKRNRATRQLLAFSQSGRNAASPMNLSFCPFFPYGKNKGQAANAVFKRDGGAGLSFCPFSPRVRVMCACAYAYIKGIFPQELKNRFSILFSKKRTKGQETAGSGIDKGRGVCPFVFSNEKKGQKDKGEIKEVAETLAVCAAMSVFGLIFWGAMFACWWIGVNF